MAKTSENESDDRQVSEVGGLDPAQADTPISDSQAVAGNPEGETGEDAVGPAGPNAVPDWDATQPK
ncbi:hypothetical protein GCM10027020_15380 [Nocardioides salsibiostraticola]